MMRERSSKQMYATDGGLLMLHCGCRTCEMLLSKQRLAAKKDARILQGWRRWAKVGSASRSDTAGSQLEMQSRAAVDTGKE